ncbi:MAG: CocE/NonD family hydrolase [Paracoccaceae bacterium]
MRIVEDFPRAVREIAHVDVPMRDGCRLGARIWMPEEAESAPVPAILEYIPYRKGDLCAPEDRATGRYLAGHGYAYVRLDLRGAGDSEGLMRDEYLAQEQADGVDAIAWIAGQSWCDGAVGMIGISWGGFNGLQIAAHRPPALKAVITVCSTDDRYADDIHYMGGCLLLDQLSWASQMFARNTLPPDPACRPDWREQWRARLDGSGLWLKNWLEHQRRDAFWRHGSICEDYADVEVPVYAVSGWADGYCRAVLRLCENLPGPRKGLIGPWAHKYPHVGVPGPAIGWLQETLRWWDHWLKGRDTGIMDEPMLRLFMQDHAPPAGQYAERAGRWVAEPAWPSPNVTPTRFHLAARGALVEAPEDDGDAALAVAPAAWAGSGGGKWCSYAVPGDQPVDQRADDALALVFETAPLARDLEIAGDAALEVELCADRPMAQVAARLSDVAPDGAVTRCAYGVLNLAHREGHAEPRPLTPGERVRVRVPFKPVAQTFRAGHRVRLALSPEYFPVIWPSPEPVTLTIFPAASTLVLPVRAPSAGDERLAPFGAPERGAGPTVETVEAADAGWTLVRDLGAGTTALDVTDGSGVRRLVEDGVTITKKARERYEGDDRDPQAVTASTVWEMGLERGDWRVSSLTETTLTADATHFVVRARQRAWEGEALIDDRAWDERIPRDHC